MDKPCHKDGVFRSQNDGRVGAAVLALWLLEDANAEALSGHFPLAAAGWGICAQFFDTGFVGDLVSPGTLVFGA